MINIINILMWKMKIAILSVTKRTIILEYLRSILIKDSLIIKKTDLYHKNVKSTINSIFNDCNYNYWNNVNWYINTIDC